MKLLRNKKLMMVLAIAWTILIFIGCSLPGKDLPPISVFDHFDKIVHFTFFFVFAILWLLAFSPAGGGLRGWKFPFFLILTCFAYGFFLEWYQINFVPGRAWDVWDGFADGVGGIFGVLFFKKFLMKFV
jgi:VanZ family protein